MDNLNRGVKNQNCYLSKLTSLFILSLLVFFLSYNKALAGNVTVVQPTNYVVGINLGVGSQYYIDRTFTITSIPSQLQGPQGEITLNGLRQEITISPIRVRTS